MMTEREMAGKNLFKLLILLYDICKDALKDFFRTKCDKDKSSFIISKYIKDHKERLYEHFNKGECHLSSHHENQQACIKIKLNQFAMFFESVETLEHTIRNENEPDLDLLKEKDLDLDSLDIFSLQYLLLAGDLQQKEHQLVIDLYAHRLHLSELCSVDISDDQYSTISGHAQKIVTDMYQIHRDRWQVDMVVKQMELLSMAEPPWKVVRGYWNTIQEEFDLKGHAFVPEHIALPEVIKDVGCASLTLNINAENVCVGENITTMGCSNNIERQLNEMLASQKEMKHLIERFGPMFILANVKDLQEKTDNERDESSGATGLQAGKMTANTERKTYTVEWHIKNPQGLDQDDKMAIIRNIESVVIPDAGQIDIKFVHRGSLVIGTTITGNIVEDVNLFFTAFKRFFKVILERCNIETNTETILQVDVTITESNERQATSRAVLPVCEKCLEKTKEIIILQSQLKQTHEEHYSYFVKPTDSIKSVGSLSTLENRTIYAKVDEKEILYAEFPKVLVTACNNYEHMVDSHDIVASMTKGKKYYLIKKVGDWSEIIETVHIDSESSTSFFVLSKYLQIICDDPEREPVLTPYKPSSIVKRGLNLSRGSNRKDLSGSIVSINRDDEDSSPEDPYAEISDADQQEVMLRTRGHAPLRRAVSEDTSSPLRRRHAKRFSESESCEKLAVLERKEAISKYRALSYSAPEKKY